MTSEITDGDWVQAMAHISDSTLGVHCACPRSIGRVVGLPEDEDMYTVQWERTGCVIDCFEWEITKICDADARPRISLIGKGSEAVAELIQRVTEVFDVQVCKTPQDALDARRIGGVVWGIKRTDEVTAFDGVANEYIYYKDAAVDIPEVIRWKLRDWVPFYVPVFLQRSDV